VAVVHDAGELMADTCKICGAAVLWATTKNGKTTPLDAEPAENGNLELVTMGGKLHAVPAGKQPLNSEPVLFCEPGAKRYRSHFATCPEAGDWRKRHR